MTQKRIDLLQSLSNKREIEELTREEKKLYKELLEEYEDHAIDCNIAHDRAEI
jgi:hypothetical protein